MPDGPLSGPSGTFYPGRLPHTVPGFEMSSVVGLALCRVRIGLRLVDRPRCVLGGRVHGDQAQRTLAGVDEVVASSRPHEHEVVRRRPATRRPRVGPHRVLRRRGAAGRSPDAPRHRSRLQAGSPSPPPARARRSGPRGGRPRSSTPHPGCPRDLRHESLLAPLQLARFECRSTSSLTARVGPLTGDPSPASRSSVP